MPGVELSPGQAKADAKTCAQCHEKQATENVRGRHMCRTCFCSYIGTKCVKRMEAFRTRHSSAGQKRLLLLPLSLGVSSVALLYLLDEQLKRQLSKSGRTGFQLHILHVDTSPDEDMAAGENATVLERIKSRFPSYTYTTLPLSQVMTLPDLRDLLLQNNIEPPPPTTSPSSASTPTLSTLSHFLSSLPSATSRADTLLILRQKLITSFALSPSLNCEAILWADTTTRLAEKTLAETAKGRGFSLAWAISDGASPHGIDFYYPLRDLLKKEIVAFTRSSSSSAAAAVAEKWEGDNGGDPDLETLVIHDAAPSTTVVNAKNSSIDELMRGYFSAVEANYPSIVANVVRTTSRLQVPVADGDGWKRAGNGNGGGKGGDADASARGNDTADENPRCGFCALPIISVAGGGAGTGVVEDGFMVGGGSGNANGSGGNRHGKGSDGSGHGNGSTGASAGVTRHGIRFCHGCARSFPLSSV